MLEVFNTHKPAGSNRLLHVGSMMSYKTLHNIPNRYQQVFPSRETIIDIFREKLASQVYYCLHYADYNHNTHHQDITRILRYDAGPFVHALQLDMPWPNPEMIARGVRLSGKQIEVILQVGRNSFSEVGNDPLGVVSRLESYNNIIHRVLLDKSMGEGRSMDAVELSLCIRAIKKRLPRLKITVAGGLGPNSIELVEPLVKKFPDISIDAQGRLRPSGSILDPIDWDMAKEYLIKALSLWK